jgi:hypothetical protein
LDTPEEATFEKDLTRLINCYSKENGSDTPDFILALYLQWCLSVFNTAIQLREKWYGREINQKVTEATEPQPPCDNEHVADGCEKFQ